MPDEPLTCSANTSPASAATLSPSASPPCSDNPRERTTTSRTWRASFPVATQPDGHARYDRRPSTSDHPVLRIGTLPTTRITRRDQIMPTPAAVSARSQERPVAHRRTAVVVGVLFLSFTVTFFIGNTLIHSYFSRAPNPAGTLIGGGVL